MIKSLTSLRGIFILFIFLHHCRQFYIGGGSMAVAFFFVLGGFSMAIGYKERVFTNFSYKQYLIRRLLKFYPLHWLCLLAALPLVSFALWKIPVFFVNAALLQTLVPIKGVYFSFNMVSWYLANTMLFSVVFPFVFRIIMRASSVERGIGILFLSLVYVVLVNILPFNLYHAILYVSPILRLLDFIFGIFLAIIYWEIKVYSKLQLSNNIVSQFVIFVIISLLVLESSILPENIQLIAPVYWPLIAILILTASLSSTSPFGGGQSS